MGDLPGGMFSHDIQCLIPDGRPTLHRSKPISLRPTPYRFCHGSRDKNYRMLPSKMEISIHTSDTRCLIFTCKIPANSLENLLSYGDLSPDSSRAPPEHAPPQPEVA